MVIASFLYYPTAWQRGCVLIERPRARCSGCWMATHPELKTSAATSLHSIMSVSRHASLQQPGREMCKRANSKPLILSSFCVEGPKRHVPAREVPATWWRWPWGDFGVSEGTGVVGWITEWVLRNRLRALSVLRDVPLRLVWVRVLRQLQVSHYVAGLLTLFD